MSAGAYMFGQMLQVMGQNPAQFNRIRENVAGFVFDSPVDTVGIPTAAADLLGSRPGQVLWRVVHAVLGAYFTCTYPLTMAKLRRASNNVKQMPEAFRHCPQLWLYSEDDRVASAAVIEGIVDSLRDLGISVDTHRWDSSRHVSHFREHEADYRKLVTGFLQRVGMPLAPEASGSPRATGAAEPPPRVLDAAKAKL